MGVLELLLAEDKPSWWRRWLVTPVITELIVKFKDSPPQFIHDFGLAAFYGVVAWMVVAPFAVVIIKVSVVPILRQLRCAILKRREVMS